MLQTATGDIIAVASVPQTCEWPHQGSIALKLYDPKRHGEVILRSFRKQGINRVQRADTQEQKTRQHTWGLQFFDNLDSCLE